MNLFVNIQKKPNQKIISFLTNCFIQTTKEKPYCNGPYSFCNTYHDLECLNLQNKYALRSVEMIHCVIKTYYPKCTDKNFWKQLKAFFKKGILFDGRKFGIEMHYCPDVNKWVVGIHNYEDLSTSENNLYIWNYQNSIAKKHLTGEGIYSYNQIMNNMGFTGYSEEEILEKENTNSGLAAII